MSKVPSIEKTVATIRRAVAKRPPEERMEWLLLATAKFAETARTAREESERLRKRAEAAEDIVSWYENECDEDHCLDKPEDLERLCIIWACAAADTKAANDA